MKTHIDQHGQRVEVIGSVRTGRMGSDERAEIRLVFWVSGGREYVTLQGRTGCHKDFVGGARGRALAIKKAKFVYSDASNGAQWLV